MLDYIADLLSNSIESITREWVEELRSSDRTDIHKQLLTSEIINGTKALLQNLADALAHKDVNAKAGTALPTPTVPRLPSLEELSSTAQFRSRGTTPLNNPLIRAGHVASSHGRLRHNQGFEIHEVMVEFVNLRQIILRKLVDSGTVTPKEFVDAVPILDLLFDELVLTAVESFHRASVRDLEKRAIHDNMTELYNKEYFGQRLGEEMRRSLRSGEPLTVAMIDMDNLKTINDTYGHAAGDNVIQAVASMIRQTCRRGDVPCRIGGDEFAVIMPETAKLQGRVFGERLMRGLAGMTTLIGANGGMKVASTAESRVESGSASLVVPVPTISVGMAAFPEDARNPETLIAKADAALYRAKHAGRNSIAF